MKKAETVQPLWSRFLLSTGTNAPSPPRCAPGSLVPVLAINRDQCLLPSSVPVRGPTGTSFSPGLLVPVGQPGLKAPTNRDNRGVCPLVRIGSCIVLQLYCDPLIYYKYMPKATPRGVKPTLIILSYTAPQPSDAIRG